MARGAESSLVLALSPRGVVLLGSRASEAGRQRRTHAADAGAIGQSTAGRPVAAGLGLVVISTIHPELSSLQSAVISDTESTQKAVRVRPGIPALQRTSPRCLGSSVRPEAAEAAATPAPTPGLLTPRWGSVYQVRAGSRGPSSYSPHELPGKKTHIIYSLVVYTDT